MSLHEPRTRIAPTPSGYLHAGNGIAFLLTAHLARSLGARLRLRIDDLDADRARPAFVDDIFASLQWLGIAWDDGPRDRADHERNSSQADRTATYSEALDLLKEQGDLYACTCSRKAMAELQRQGLKPCHCRAKQIPFTTADAAWRLRIPADAVVRMDPVQGDAVLLQPAELMSDPIVRQRATAEVAARPSYQIASLLDDVEHGITHIVRGEDLLPSTACQIHLADRLGLEAFKRVRFLHHPLITDADGRKLSKSEGAAALKTMREAGGTADALSARAMELLKELALPARAH